MKRLLITTLFIGTTLLSVGNAKGAEPMIEDGKTVLFDYVLTVDGEQIDSSEGRGPLSYVQGKGNIVPGLEKELTGLQIGDKKSVVVEPEGGYGPINPNAFQEIPKSQLPGEIELKPGTVLSAQAPDGRAIPVVISEVRDDTVLLNFNHPLAGKELHFDVTIVEIK